MPTVLDVGSIIVPTRNQRLGFPSATGMSSTTITRKRKPGFRTPYEYFSREPFFASIIRSTFTRAYFSRFASIHCTQSRCHRRCELFYIHYTYHRSVCRRPYSTEICLDAVSSGPARVDGMTTTSSSVLCCLPIDILLSPGVVRIEKCCYFER